MTSSVCRVRFGTLTSDEWLKYGVVELTRPSSKGGTEKNRSGTPYDERMGALENGKECLTCRYNNQDCVGHFGYIILPEPVYNHQFLKIICHVLQCVCPTCSRPRILPEDAVFSGLTRLSRFSRLREFVKRCQSIETCPWEGCNDALPSFSYERNLDEIQRYYGKKKTAQKIPFTAANALAVFIRISNEHLQTLGFNQGLEDHCRPERVSVVEEKDHILQFRPESMIFTVLPVVPPIARPFVVREDEKCDDDLTDKYNSIIKACNKLREPEGTSSSSRGKKTKKPTESERLQQFTNLQNHIWTLMDNHLEKSKLSSGGRPHKCLRSRVEGKGGHIQGNIGGKRVDFSGRSVIVGGGILLDVDELGVPRYIAERLTKKELTKEWNRSYIQDLVDQGKVVRVERWDKDRLRPRVIRVRKLKSFFVELGDVIERQLRDGDYVMFNRQPSLRVESMQSFRVKITDGYAFRLPLALTKPYNADFDGDEMNLHVPQGVQASAEVATLMQAPMHFVTPQNNKPIAGIVQDGLTGSYLLSNTWLSGSTDTLVKKSVFMDCVTGANIPIQRYRDLLQRAQKWYPEFIREDLTLEDEIPGKLMFSILFPPNLCYTRCTDTSDEFPIVKIDNGVLLPDSGPICSKIIGAKKGSLVQILWKEYSPEVVKQFLSENQRLIDYWLPHHGFSMGISDCQSTDYNEVIRALAQTQLAVQNLTKNDTGDDLESEITSLLNEAGNIGPLIARKSMHKGERNSLNIMRLSGAKGNIANLSAIVAFVGQQNINGRRVPPTLGGSRTLPRFEPGDNSPEARGMIYSNYIGGLNPFEVYFHAMAGREGVIATAIRTAETGYIQKKISRKEEDLSVHHDGSVRNSNGRIIQFLYGDDGMDPQKLYGCKAVPFPFFVDPPSIAQRMNKDVEGSQEITSKPRALSEHELQFLMKYIKAGAPRIQTDITEQATKSLQAALRRTLQNVSIYECKIADFCGEIVELLETSKSQHGDMVGLIAAASCGEPTTQLSTTRDTIVIVRTGSEVVRTPIGDLIDDLMKTWDIKDLGKGSEVAHPEDIHILTVDPNTEKTNWQPVTEISRHPANGGLAKITTKSGRTVTTTLSHSHLSRTREGKIVPKVAKDLKLGDRIPVCRKMNSKVLFKSFDIGETHFDLDFENGWMFGAYLAEGNITCETQLQIANVSPHFGQRIRAFSKRYGGTYRITEKTQKIDPRYPKYLSRSHHVSGIPHLIRFIWQQCGTGSKTKKVPGFALFAPEDFVSGLLRGYFDGDGNVNSSKHMIRVHSISRGLLEDIALLLSRFGVFGTFGIEKKKRSNPLYNYVLLRKYARVFLNRIGSDFPEKKKALNEIAEYNERENAKSRREDIDRIPMVGAEIARVALPLKFPGYSRNYKRWAKKESVGRETLRKYLQIFQKRAAELGTKADLALLKRAVDNDIVWDSIVSIDILPDPEELVYDFGVQGNHTFMVANGIFVHNTLNVFHATGLKGADVSLGVPRFKEILNVTESPKNPSCTVYFVDQILQDGTQVILKNEALLLKRQQKDDKKIQAKGNSRNANSRKLGLLKKKCRAGQAVFEKLIKQNRTKCQRHLEIKRKTFEETQVGSLILEYEMQYLEKDVDPQTQASPTGIISYNKYQDPWWVILSRKLHAEAFEPQYWVLIIKLNVEEMCRKSFTIEEIAERIEKSGGGNLSCVASPNNMGIIQIAANFSNIREFLQEKGFIKENKALNTEGLPRRLMDQNLEYFLCRDGLVPFVKSINLSGTPGIRQVYSYEDPITHEWMLKTRGSNFRKVLAIPGVDPTRTVTNSIWEIYRTLGIEATRRFLIEEVTRILSFGGTYVNPRHIQLLVDSMTDTGDITNVNRNGISRAEGPIKKIMFEQPIDNTVEAAAFVEEDRLQSVASSIMYGKVAKSGTGMVQIQANDRVPVKPLRIPRNLKECPGKTLGEKRVVPRRRTRRK